jgi:hypothetical protein
VLNVPSGVEVRKVDLSIELQILAFHAQRRGGAVEPSDRKRDGRLAGRRIDGVPHTTGALETHSAPGGDAVPTGGQDLSVAGLSATARLDVAAGLAAQGPRHGAAAGDTADEHGTPDDFETGVQAVGT